MPSGSQKVIFPIIKINIFSLGTYTSISLIGKSVTSNSPSSTVLIGAPMLPKTEFAANIGGSIPVRDLNSESSRALAV